MVYFSLKLCNIASFFISFFTIYHFSIDDNCYSFFNQIRLKANLFGLITDLSLLFSAQLCFNLQKIFINLQVNI